MKPLVCCTGDCEAKAQVEALQQQSETQQQQINDLLESNLDYTTPKLYF